MSATDTLEPTAPVTTVKAYLRPIDGTGLAAFAGVKGRLQLKPAACALPPPPPWEPNLRPWLEVKKAASDAKMGGFHQRGPVDVIVSWSMLEPARPCMQPSFWPAVML